MREQEDLNRTELQSTESQRCERKIEDSSSCRSLQSSFSVPMAIQFVTKLSGIALRFSPHAYVPGPHDSIARSYVIHCR